MSGEHILFLFLDGVGIGAETDHNPFVHARTPTLRRLLGTIPTTASPRCATADALCIPLDATLGVQGLPQSGTGQATLLTGENCAARNGAHFGPYPPAAIRPLLAKWSLFARLRAEGRSFEFANAYPALYFARLDAHPVMWPAMASAYRAAGGVLHTADDLRAGQAVSADFLNARWTELGHAGVPLRAPVEVGACLGAIVESHAFTLHENFLTDKAGHARDMTAAIACLETFDAVLGAILQSADLRDTTLVITSDHGNMEDLTTASHTRNAVPLIVAGSARHAFANARSLADVAPALLRVLGVPREPPGQGFGNGGFG